jgi:uncharacterized protein YqiB (DUF1249 family)
MTIQNQIFDQLQTIIPDLQTRNKAGNSQLESQTMMDLNLDILEKKSSISLIALSHYYKHQSGDMIADPDMEILVNFEHRIATARTYQDSFGYQDVRSSGEVDSDLEHSLNEFLIIWLNNSISYGHKID